MFGDIEVTEEFDGIVFRDFLEKELRFSKRTIISMKKVNGTKINGIPKKVDTRLRTGDRISFIFPEVEASEVSEEPMDLEILFEDEYFIGINKKAGIPIHPCRNYPTGTLANGIMARLLDQKERPTIHPVTRLDKDTSGIALFAKHPHVQYLLTKEPFQSSFQKKYLAILSGHMDPENGLIDLPIERLEEGKVRRGVIEIGAPSRTEYKTVGKNAEISLLHIVLHTGRTHQIRVHFSHFGHPLVGDSLYEGPCEELNRQALHAAEMTFLHPITHQNISLVAPLPEDMKKVLEKHHISFCL